eukprot:scaffold123095_cov16-Tisochrysis_lutea.AAC.2
MAAHDLWMKLHGWALMGPWMAVYSLLCMSTCNLDVPCLHACSCPAMQASQDAPLHKHLHFKCAPCQYACCRPAMQALPQACLHKHLGAVASMNDCLQLGAIGSMGVRPPFARAAAIRMCPVCMHAAAPQCRPLRMPPCTSILVLLGLWMAAYDPLLCTGPLCTSTSVIQTRPCLHACSCPATQVSSEAPLQEHLGAVGSMDGCVRLVNTGTGACVAVCQSHSKYAGDSSIRGRSCLHMIWNRVSPLFKYARVLAGCLAQNCVWCWIWRSSGPEVLN